VLHRPFYGVLLAPTFVLAAYAGQHASPHDLIRPLIVSMAFAAALFGLIGLTTRRWHAAAVIVSFVTIAVMAAELTVLVLVWPILVWRLVRHGHSWGISPRLTYPLNTFVGVWFVLAAVTAVVISLPTPGLSAGRTEGDERRSTVPVIGEQGRNVYLIWLDGYPRHDTLLEYFGFDNRPFLDALEERGFAVSEKSESDYPSSIQTMATMLQGAPLDELLGSEWTGSHEQHRLLWHHVNQATMAEPYREAGYETYSIVSPAPGHDWQSADVVLDSPWPSNFEAHLLSRGPLRSILPWRAMHRADMLDAFTYLEASAGESPRFVFAHILKPHDPYVFTADGGPAPICGAPCENHAGPANPVLGERLIGQIEWLNGKVLHALDRIIDVDPEAVVVVFSDHGLRRDPNDMDEWFRTLFAARGHAFADDASPGELISNLHVQLRASAGD
jgi:Sulfatase